MADITGLSELQAAFRQLQRTTGANVRRALARCGLIAQREAKANAPRSPTNKILSVTLKRKRRTSRRMLPGGLEKSIEYEVLPGGTGCSVFVAANAPAASYARRIHDEKGRTWRNRGPGTVAKGPRAATYESTNTTVHHSSFFTYLQRWRNTLFKNHRLLRKRKGRLNAERNEPGRGVSPGAWVKRQARQGGGITEQIGL